jgi:hypothetical protein
MGAEPSGRSWPIADPQLWGIDRPARSPAKHSASSARQLRISGRNEGEGACPWPAIDRSRGWCRSPGFRNAERAAPPRDSRRLRDGRACSAEFDPKQASSMSGRRFLAPLITERRRRIAGDRPAMAEPGSTNERPASLRWLGSRHYCVVKTGSSWALMIGGGFHLPVSASP